MVVDDAVIWHLICNDHGCYMDYTDSRIDAIPGLYPAGIDTNLVGFHHIVGWCPEVEVLTGMRQLKIVAFSFQIYTDHCGTCSVATGGLWHQLVWAE